MNLVRYLYIYPYDDASESDMTLALPKFTITKICDGKHTYLKSTMTTNKALQNVFETHCLKISNMARQYVTKTIIKYSFSSRFDKIFSHSHLPYLRWTVSFDKKTTVCLMFSSMIKLHLASLFLPLPSMSACGSKRFF